MSELLYLRKAAEALQRIEQQRDAIARVAARAADTIVRGHWVRLFGSGHSVLPAMDCFPRYGSFVGFLPMMDPRLMWTTVSGPGGAEEVLWLERQEHYVDVFLRHERWDPDDMLIVISHGGQNAAPVEVALAAKKAGLFLVAVTSEENHLRKPATHSSGKKIGDLADVVLFNGAPAEDAAVPIPGVLGNVGGLSTLGAIALIQTLVSETALALGRLGYKVRPFASPNTEGVEPSRNEDVYQDFRSRLWRL